LPAFDLRDSRDGLENRSRCKPNPAARYVGKVVVNDTDHLWGHTGGDAVWVWKSVLRGLNVLFMEELTPGPTWQDSARSAMGQARRLSERGRTYVAFRDGSQGESSIDLTGAAGPFAVEWLDVTTGRTHPGRAVDGGGRRVVTTPFPGPAVVILTAGTGGSRADGHP
jgi:hypothetical protein